MATTVRLSTAADLMHMPTDEPWEIWEGELRQVPGAGGKASWLAVRIAVFLSRYVDRVDGGFVTGADGSYILQRDPDTVVEPDVAFVRRDRLPGGKLPEGYIPVPPDLAVEVASPSDRPGDIARKQELYRRAGVPLVWWVYPDRRAVVVFRHGEYVAELHEGDELDGDPALPDLRLPVAEIFGENEG